MAREASSSELTGILGPETLAPDFTLSSGSHETISLHQFRGRPVVLVFYAADFSPVCSDELVLFSEALSRIEEFDAQVLGISVDNVWSHEAFAEEKMLQFPLLSDFHPKGAVGRMYGVFRELDGVEDRALFVIDREGVIRWSQLSPTMTRPGVDGVLEALQELLLEEDRD